MPDRGQSFLSKGFTLSEILIALAILAIILAVSIPTIAIKRQQDQRKAIFREGFVALYSILREGMITDEVQPGNVHTYFLSRANAVTTCYGPSSTTGCWDLAKQGPAPSNEHLTQGFVLANGMQVVGITACCDYGGGIYMSDFIMDWNGAKPPNTIGDDWLWVRMCFGTIDCPPPFTTIPIKTGTFAPDERGALPNQALFDAVMGK
jgi:prepilin-type N-terminal cleavage/methylation domain-containing protein